MNKKSQAALEFLTTYAWAFLVIIIMISALAYFGILSPSKLLPDRCNFGAEIGCDSNRMIVVDAPAATLTLDLKNNFGEPVIVTGVTITSDSAAAGTCTATTMGGAVLPYTWSSGKFGKLVVGCAGESLSEGEKIKFELEVEYYSAAAGSTYTKTVYGEIITTVQ